MSSSTPIWNKLLEKHIRVGLSVEKAEELELLRTSSAAKEAEFQALTDPAIFWEDVRQLEQLQLDTTESWETFSAQHDLKKIWLTDYRKRTIKTWLVKAAVVLLGVGCAYAGYWYFKPTPAQVVHKHAMPGVTYAALITPGRQPIILDFADTGSLEKRDVVQLYKAAHDTLEMQERYREAPLEQFNNETNTLTVPERKPYTVVLRDGTIATIGAGSSLTFQDTFTGTQREVQATGEVYFSVNRNAAWPFIVHIDDNTYIKVTGTRFRIRAFANEPIQVTLIEGHVTVVDSGKETRLEAGEQVTLYAHKELNMVKLKDPESAAFIPQREFNFNGLDIRSVLLQMSQWYGQPIVVYGKLSGDPSSGRFPRHEKMTDILRTLKRYNDFDFEEKDGLVIITGHAK